MRCRSAAQPRQVGDGRIGHPPRRRIVFVGNFGLRRKATMAFRSLPMARELRLAGYEASLVVPPWDEPESSATIERRWGVPIRRVRVQHTPPRGLDHPALAFRLLRAALDERPDVVVAVKPKAYAGLLALLFAALRPIRLVVDADDWEAAWSALARDPPPVRALVAAHERVALRVAAHVTAASREVALRAAAAGVASGRVTYLPNATWPGSAAWPRAASARPRGGPRLLVYSRLFEMGVDRLVAVCRGVFAGVPDVRLVVVGAGLQGEDLLLRRRLAAAGLEARADVLGWVPVEALPRTLRQTDVALAMVDDTVVNRARCSVKLLDLMLAGRPIVAEAVGEVVSYLSDGTTGRVIRPGDASGLVAATVDLLRHPAAARRLGRAAEAAARGRFTWEAQRRALVRAIVGPS